MKEGSGSLAGSTGTVVSPISFCLISSPRSVRGRVDRERLLKPCRHCIVGLCSCRGSKKAEVNLDLDRSSSDKTTSPIIVITGDQKLLQHNILFYERMMQRVNTISR
mmetsp:Transcript_3133/g.5293  ORF Transcript_3133/g.5293 Transcript_3133/m.5293 type:complete len:107 (-) Transcript_3133:64-384(-)